MKPLTRAGSVHSTTAPGVAGPMRIDDPRAIIQRYARSQSAFRELIELIPFPLDLSLASPSLTTFPRAFTRSVITLTHVTKISAAPKVPGNANRQIGESVQIDHNRALTGNYPPSGWGIIQGLRCGRVLDPNVARSLSRAATMTVSILRCGTKDRVLLMPQSRQRINSGRSPCRRIASKNRSA